MDRLPDAAFQRTDEGPDDLFYGTPRLVTHIDESAIGALTSLYAELLSPGGVILDLMSSWVSHLPDDISYGRVAGHGMNAEELSHNSRLDDYILQDLNSEPTLPFDEDTFDGAAISVSVQYLTRPYAVMSDLARVLRPGSPLIISFSNRCFPTKAVNVWQILDGPGHGHLVTHYLDEAQAFQDITCRELIGVGSGSDPLWAVVAYAAPGADR